MRDLVLYFSGLLLLSSVALQPRAEQIIPPARAVNKGVIYARRASPCHITQVLEEVMTHQAIQEDFVQKPNLEVHSLLSKHYLEESGSNDFLMCS